MNPDVAPGLIIILIGVIIIVAVFAPPDVPWPSEVVHHDEDADCLSSIEPVRERMIPFDEAEKLANGCPDPDRYQ